MHIYNINVIVCKINYVAIHAYTCTYILNEGVGVGVLDLCRYILEVKTEILYMYDSCFISRTCINCTLIQVLL